MAEHVDPAAFQRPEQPIGHLRLVLAELRVDGRDHEVELGEAIVSQVEPAVRENVTLDPGEQRQCRRTVR